MNITCILDESECDEWNVKLSARRRCLRCHECKRKFQADCLKIRYNSRSEHQIYKPWHKNRTKKKHYIKGLTQAKDGPTQSSYQQPTQPMLTTTKIQWLPNISAES